MMERAQETGEDPLRRIMDTMAKAREWRDVSFLEWAEGEDPMASLEQKVAMAREDNRTEGQRAMETLQDRIRAARRLPEPKDYKRPDRPMEQLMERVKGQLPDDSEGGAGQESDSTKREATPAPATSESPVGGPEMAVGRQLIASLEGRALEGGARAEAASLVAEMMEDFDGDERLHRLWDLLVFGGT